MCWKVFTGFEFSAQIFVFFFPLLSGLMVIINAHSFDQKGISESIQQRITFAVILYCCQQISFTSHTEMNF